MAKVKVKTKTKDKIVIELSVKEAECLRRLIFETDDGPLNHLYAELIDKVYSHPDARKVVGEWTLNERAIKWDNS